MDIYPVIPDMKLLNIRFQSSSVPGYLNPEKPTASVGERSALSSRHSQVFSNVAVTCRLGCEQGMCVMEQSSIDVRQSTVRASIKEFFTNANTPGIAVLSCA